MKDNNKLEMISNLFEGKEIRSIWDSNKEDYYFSVVDVIGALTDSNDASHYWRTLKSRMIKEGNETVTKCDTFKFKAKDIHYIAELMKAKTAGANISPLSSKNLPKSTIEIPSEENAKYKEIISSVNEVDTLIIYHFTNDFCSKILTKTLRKNDKSYDFKKDIRQKKMSRNIKTYIWSMGFWDEYLAYLRKKIQTYYKNKEKE